MNGLIVKQPFASWIIDGSKEWEIRSRPAPKGKINKEILLLSSGLVLGKVVITKCWEADKNILEKNKPKHLSDTEMMDEDQILHVWQIKIKEKFAEPKRYDHPMGARVWINDVDLTHQQKILHFV